MAQVDNLEIKSDVLAQLRLFKSSSFVDPYCFIAEFVQNAQRAGAKTLQISESDGIITFEDDGPGLSSPESLFTIGATGWDEDVIASERPFGIGFFSCLSVADMVLVESLGRFYQFSYPEIMAKGSPEVQSFPSDRTSGFFVRLSSLSEQYRDSVFRNKVREVCSTIRGLSCYLNGQLIECEDYMKMPKDRLAVPVDIPGYASGWLGLPKRSWDVHIRLYHRDRFVCDFYMEGIDGALSIELDTLNLRSPDRRDYIHDEKVEKFRDMLRSYAKQVYLCVFDQELSRDTIRNIQTYLEPSEYAYRLKFHRITNLKPIKNAERLDSSTLEDMSSEDFEGLFSDLEETSEVEIEERVEQIDEPDYSINSVPTHQDHSHVIPAPEFRDLKPEEEKKLSTRDNRFTTINRLTRNRVVYYVEPKDLAASREVIKALLDLSIPVLLTRTTLEAKALETLPSAKYLNGSDYRRVTEIKVGSTSTSLKGRRIAKLLSLLLNRIGSNLNPVVCDLVVKERHYLDDIEISDTELTPAFILSKNDILIDQNAVSASKILNMSDPRTDIAEVFFLIENLSSLVKALGLPDTTESYDKLVKMLTSLRTSWIVTNRISEEE